MSILWAIIIITLALLPWVGTGFPQNLSPCFSVSGDCPRIFLSHPSHSFSLLTLLSPSNLYTIILLISSSLSNLSTCPVHLNLDILIDLVILGDPIDTVLHYTLFSTPLSLWIIGIPTKLLFIQIYSRQFDIIKKIYLWTN